jgi:hypothetical protein
MNQGELAGQVLALMERGVSLTVNGENLHVDAPKKVLTLGDVAFLFNHKTAILHLLREITRPRLPAHELGEHLLQQAEKAARSALQAEQNNNHPKANQEWARAARLRQAADQFLAPKDDETTPEGYLNGR